jgi:ATP-dependent DNA ligase
MFLLCSLLVKPPDAVAQMDRATALQARDESAERRAIGHEIKLDGYRMAAA